MKDAVLDGNFMKTMKATHTMFREELNFSERYKNNMDSLFDELLNINEETTVKIVNYSEMEKNLGEYAEIYRSIFEDVEKLNPKLHVIIEDGN